MTTLEYFRRGFAYDAWANRETLASLHAAGTPPAKSVERMAHVVSAGYVWFDRLKQQRQSFPVWPQMTLAQCAEESTKLAVLWKNYLESQTESGLSAAVTYKNTIGESWTSTVEDVLTHVLMHGAYHRGQIASDLRAAGFTPAYTDYIHGVRQGFVK